MVLIEEEKLKPDETREFIERSFRDGELKTIGTDIDKIMPPVSRFGGSGRADKKTNLIRRLMAYFPECGSVLGNMNAARLCSRSHWRRGGILFMGIKGELKGVKRGVEGTNILLSFLYEGGYLFKPFLVSLIEGV